MIININKMVFSNEYIMEIGSPTLVHSLKKFLAALEEYKKTDDWGVMESPFCELQSEINCAEVDGVISCEAANWLRKEYIWG